MRSLAARWLIDSVDLVAISTTQATRANMSDGTLTAGTVTRVRALIREPSVVDTDTQTADRTVRDLDMWVEDCALVVAGMRATIHECGDLTLVGEAGTVLTVERDTFRASRRITVRMTNSD